MSALPQFRPSLLRLVFAPRAVVAGIVAVTFVLMIGVGAYVVRPTPEDLSDYDHFSDLPRIAFLLVLIGVPLALGFLMSEIAQEVSRRPSTSRLPGLVSGMSREALLSALVTALLIVFLLRVFGADVTDSVEQAVPELAVAATALTGFTFGVWGFFRVSRTLDFFLRFAVLLTFVVFVPSLVQLGAVPACALLVGAALVIPLRFHSSLLRWSSSGNSDYSLGTFSPATPMWKNVAHTLPKGLPADGSVSWDAVSRYARVGKAGLMGRPLGAALMVVALACLQVTIAGFIDEQAFSVGALIDMLVEALIGSGSGQEMGLDTDTTVLRILSAVILGTFGWDASRPLPRGMFHPIARSAHGRLALRALLRLSLEFSGWLIAVSFTLAALLIAYRGEGFDVGLPGIISGLALGLCLAPIAAMLASTYRRFSGGAAVVFRSILMLIALFFFHVLLTTSWSRPETHGYQLVAALLVAVVAWEGWRRVAAAEARRDHPFR